MKLSVAIEKRLGAFHLRAQFETDGDILALLGASGCGKSMTLKCIAGIERPDCGRIVLDDKVLFDSEKKINLPPQKRQVGYLFQQYALFPNMTARQNILAGARKLPKAAREARADSLIMRLHLSGFAHKRPYQLSGGQQQRVALARILASEPKAILLDEPFSALDSFLKWQMESELMEALRSFDGAVLWVSHDRDEVYRRCDSVCAMFEGKTDPVMPMKTLFSHPNTLHAARLSGCKNDVPFEKRGANRIFVPYWGVELHCGEIPEGARMLGVRSHSIGPQIECPDNEFWCRVEQIVENPFSMVIMVRTEQAQPERAPIRLEMDKNIWQQYAGCERIKISVAPEALLLLCGEDA